MSDHVELELAPAYALGALDADEREAFEKHLPGCPSCQQAVADAASVSGVLGLEAPAAELPAGASERLVARFRSERAAASSRPAPAPGRSGGLIAAALALVSLGLFGAAWKTQKALEAVRDEREQLEESLRNAQEQRRQLAETNLRLDAELQRCRRHGAQAETVARLLGDPGRRRGLKAARGDFQGALAVGFDEKTREVAVAGAALPALSEGKVYKLWVLVEAGGGPVPLGALDAGGRLVDRVPDGKVSGFAVSIEAAPGNVTKPTDVVLVPE